MMMMMMNQSPKPVDPALIKQALQAPEQPQEPSPMDKRKAQTKAIQESMAQTKLLSDKVQNAAREY
jgi:hypothetical protein